MLTISELAAYADVSVRTVRHYHARGLLAEPERDHSGYRRYRADDVAQLIKIRTLARSGVPLSRVAELLVATPSEFTAAIAEIDRDLRDQIRDKQRSRKQIKRLAAGDSLALPPEAVEYLQQLRELGVDETLVHGERDAWILVAGQLSDQMPTYMELKRAQLDNPSIIDFYRDIADSLHWSDDDPRWDVMIERIATRIEAEFGNESYDPATVQPISPELATLLDSMWYDMYPGAKRVQSALRERGLEGWANMSPVDKSPRPGI